jgi:hypothetical protein
LVKGLLFPPEDFMDIERYNSAYRLGIGIALVYVLLLLVPAVRNYADVVATMSRQSQRIKTQAMKLSAADLESALRKEVQFGANSQLHCQPPPSRGWDYVCSYMPTPKQSSTQLQFGVSVDSTRWVDMSVAVPFGTIIPPPLKAAPGDLRHPIDAARREQAQRDPK